VRKACCDGALSRTFVSGFAVPIDGVVGLSLPRSQHFLLDQFSDPGFEREHLVLAASGLKQPDFLVTHEAPVTLVEELRALDAVEREVLQVNALLGELAVVNRAQKLNLAIDRGGFHVVQAVLDEGLDFFGHHLGERQVEPLKRCHRRAVGAQGSEDLAEFLELRLRCSMRMASSLLLSATIAFRM